MSIIFGYEVTVYHDYPELEGTMFFSHEPQIGEKLTLSFGHKAEIFKVNHDLLTIGVKLL